LQIFERKISNIFSHTKILLPAILISSFLVKLYYSPFELPITADAFAYFGFAIDASVLKDYPNKLIGNDGWPFFLSFFFSLLPSNNFMDFMNLQRLVSISLSVITIIPIYFISKKFLNSPYPLIAALIFAFEPRIIENSVLGITESLYILLGALVLWSFLTNDIKKNYLAFLFAAFFMTVRTEGIFLFFAISIIFFLKNKNEINTIKQYLISFSVFLAILIPILLIRVENIGSNLVFDKIGIHGTDLIVSTTSNDIEKNYLIDGIVNFTKFLGWDLLPIFIFCAPIGLVIILKNRNWNNLTILITTLILSIPIFYVYSSGVQDSRYFYVLYPMFSIFFIIGLQRIIGNSKREHSILLITGILIIIGSLVFVDSRKINFDYENDVMQFTEVVFEKTHVINQYWPESRYVVISTLSNLESFPTIIYDLEYKPKFIYEKTDTLDEYIKLGKEKGLTHLIVDDNFNPTHRMQFLTDIYENENNYPFLIKEYDSNQISSLYHVKIFKIDYKIYENFNK